DLRRLQFSCLLRHRAAEIRLDWATDCLNAKSTRSTWCKKSGTQRHVDSDHNHGGSSKDICITSDSMYTRRPSATVLKTLPAAFVRKVKSGQRAGNWTPGSRLFRSLGQERWKRPFLLAGSMTI